MNELTRKIMANLAAGRGYPPAPRAEAAAPGPGDDMDLLVTAIHAALTGVRAGDIRRPAPGPEPHGRPGNIMSLNDLARLKR